MSTCRKSLVCVNEDMVMVNELLCDVNSLNFFEYELYWITIKKGSRVITIIQAVIATNIFIDVVSGGTHSGYAASYLIFLDWF